MINETQTDHDLLIELRTEMRGLRQDVKDFDGSITIRVADLEKYKLDVDSWREKNKDVLETSIDHETRIRLSEKNITRILTWGSALLIALGLAEFLINKFF